jgi:hypothetical protein
MRSSASGPAPDAEWTAISDAELAKAWEQTHPAEAAANNAGQMTYEAAEAAAGSWELDLEAFDRTMPESLEEVLADGYTSRPPTSLRRHS